MAAGGMTAIAGTSCYIAEKGSECFECLGMNGEP